MEYFDKSLLDNRPIERIDELLESYQDIIWDYSILAKYREFYSKVMEELLNYYDDRIELEPELTKKIVSNMPDDLPF